MTSPHSLQEPTLDELLLSLSPEEASYVAALKGEVFWLWYERARQRPPAVAEGPRRPS
jgi:hypothetical protein